MRGHAHHNHHHTHNITTTTSLSTTIVTILPSTTTALLPTINFNQPWQRGGDFKGGLTSTTHTTTPPPPHTLHHRSNLTTTSYHTTPTTLSLIGTVVGRGGGDFFAEGFGMNCHPSIPTQITHPDPPSQSTLMSTTLPFRGSNTNET